MEKIHDSVCFFVKHEAQKQAVSMPTFTLPLHDHYDGLVWKAFLIWISHVFPSP